jgi:tetratricopeptide (TPR) repeat protein
MKPSIRILASAVIVAVVATGAVTGAVRHAEQSLQTPPETVTYSKHIAPILNANCVTCHRTGAIGPFSLATYQDVSPRAQLVADATRSRYMPPWKPVTGAAQFLGERRISADEINLIQRWVRAGSPEGDPTELPPSLSWPDGWQRGTPDLIVTMPEPYALPARGPDVHRNFVVKIPTIVDRFVAAIELRPDTTGGVHHARLLIDRTASARRLDDADAEPGYDNRLVDQSRSPDGHFLGWAPGTLPQAVGHLAWRLEPSTDLVIKAHLVPRGAARDVQISVGFFFADAPATASPVVVQLGSQTIDIPAGDQAHVVEDSYPIPVDLDVLAIYPHAHFLATDIHASARLPDGTTKPLIQIDDWDFNWQDEYRFVEPVRLPRGSTVLMRYVFDNSASNRRNPVQPPRRVRFGPTSTDEMAELMLQVMPIDSLDRIALTQHVERKVAQIVLAGSKKRLVDDPDNAAHHADVGVNLVAVGRRDEGIEHLEAAVRLDPNSATAKYRLGTALALEGKAVDAMVLFRRALEIRPDFIEAHNNLGGLLQMAGQLDEARRHYHETLRLDPSHASAHFNLGHILLAERSFAAAEIEFRQMLAVRPDSSDAYTSLGLALVGLGRVDEAVDAYRAAIQIAPDTAEAHRHLGDALSSQGKRAEAKVSYDRAVDAELGSTRR